MSSYVDRLIVEAVRVVGRGMVKEAVNKLKVGDTITFYDESVTKMIGQITHVFPKGSKVPSGIKAYVAYDRVGGLLSLADQQEKVDFNDAYVVNAKHASGSKDSTLIWLMAYKFLEITKVKESKSVSESTTVEVQVISVKSTIRALEKLGVPAKPAKLSDEVEIDISTPELKKKVKSWMLKTGGWEQEDIDDLYPEVN